LASTVSKNENQTSGRQLIFSLGSELMLSGFLFVASCSRYYKQYHCAELTSSSIDRNLNNQNTAAAAEHVSLPLTLLPFLSLTLLTFIIYTTQRCRVPAPSLHGYKPRLLSFEQAHVRSSANASL
jgi:hypothetical protein